MLLPLQTIVVTPVWQGIAELVGPVPNNCKIPWVEYILIHDSSYQLTFGVIDIQVDGFFYTHGKGKHCFAL